MYFLLVIGIYLITRAAFATFKVVVSEGGHTFLSSCQVIIRKKNLHHICDTSLFLT